MVSIIHQDIRIGIFEEPLWKYKNKKELLYL